MTSPRTVAKPLSPVAAIGHVREWLARPMVEIIEPGARHLDILEGLLQALGVAGRMTTDAHLAALAIEYQCELHSNDADCARFSGLRWVNPL